MRQSGAPLSNRQSMSSPLRKTGPPASCCCNIAYTRWQPQSDDQRYAAQQPITLPVPQRLVQPSTGFGFVAFGDSYSAGIGTSPNGTTDACLRGPGAYPQLIHRDFVHLVGEDQTSFQHLSCTGANLDDLLSGGKDSQVDDFNITETADFALLSIGGNDLGFFDIMNSCIFRFYSFYSGTCEAALERSEAQLQDPAFEERLRLAITQILERVRWEKRLWFTVTVTGYARFFNDETDECDECSLGVWWGGPKLKRELRQKMNKMVMDVNRKIKESVEAINARFAVPRVLFVDYDAHFEGHRFCEPNVTEPDYTRNETWFFLVGGQDSGQDSGNHTLPEEPPTEPEVTSESPLVDADRCLDPANRSGDWGQLALCMMAIAARDDPTLRTTDGRFAAQKSMWHAPIYYSKSFHPRSDGHLAIRNEIYRMWKDQIRLLDQAVEL
ncbi:hypothetical protein NLU13_6987 [Sarocladium strictum]|uniref:SGNH hydrolase-type esterase domain-containing protein n=1 Tax=Sarocladium strictum TaxID=5046 RepID=A0AA39GEE4_SARSR|nr:hypothetical protein NLU13_6987 [Sarocladium strictum]